MDTPLCSGSSGAGNHTWVCVCVCVYALCGVFFSNCFSSRLQTFDPSRLERTCSFIDETLLQDFPPELFLQRPALLQVSGCFYMCMCVVFLTYCLSFLDLLRVLFSLVELCTIFLPLDVWVFIIFSGLFTWH